MNQATSRIFRPVLNSGVVYARLAGSAAPLDDKANALIAAANANGGRDNISVLLVQASPKGLHAPQRKRSLLFRWLGP